MHEADMYDKTSFITLTYDKEHLPEGGTLIRKHYVDFMKRLRKKFVPTNPFDPKTNRENYDAFALYHGVRYYMCGEYGQKNLRPHYHAILFNLDFEDDRYFWRMCDRRINRIYRSPALEELWEHGNSDIGTVTFQSASYVARYVMKKVNGADAEYHYDPHDPVTGEYLLPAPLEPEYNTMSLRPGLGKTWFDKFHAEVYPSDKIRMNDHDQKPPKYYDKLLERQNPTLWEAVQQKRIAFQRKNAANSTPARLQARETVLLEKIKRLKRTHEEKP